VLYGCESESPKGIDQLGDLGAGGRIIIKWILMKQGVNVWAVLNLHRIGSGGGIFWTW
jgi:hypothetical protein